MSNMVNTPQKGRIRAMVFKKGKIWYGVALELNMVESGDDPREVMFMLDEAIRGYIESAKKTKNPKQILNQKVDSEYEKMWKSMQQNRPVKSPIQIYNTTSFDLSSLGLHAKRS